MGGPCLVCGSATARSLDGLFDDRYGYPGTFELSRCRSCGHRSLAVAFDARALEHLYTTYYPRRSMSVADYRPRVEVAGFRAWLNGERRLAYTWVPPRVRILDVGCGFGETLGYHRSRGCEVRGVEPDANVRRVAEAYGFEVDIGVFDPGRYEPSSFDYVTMDQVIEHVADPVGTLKGVARVLRTGGAAILSTPNAEGWGARVFRRRWINWHVPYHLQFFTRRSMGLAAAAAGLAVARAKVITSSEWLHYQWAHLVTFPSPGVPSCFWSGRAPATRGQRLALRALWGVHLTRLDHLLTRAFDALGLGDNLVFELRKP